MPVRHGPWQPAQAGMPRAASPCVDQRLAARQHVLADVGRRRRRKRRPLRGEILGHLLQIGVGQDIRAGSSSAGSCAGRCGKRPAGCRDSRPACRQGAGNSRCWCLRPSAVTGRAGLHPRLHRVRRLVSRLRGRAIEGGQGNNHSGQGRGEERTLPPPSTMLVRVDSRITT